MRPLKTKEKKFFIFLSFVVLGMVVEAVIAMIPAIIGFFLLLIAILLAIAFSLRIYGNYLEEQSSISPETDWEDEDFPV